MRGSRQELLPRLAFGLTVTGALEYGAYSFGSWEKSGRAWEVFLLAALGLMLLAEVVAFALFDWFEMEI